MTRRISAILRALTPVFALLLLGTSLIMGQQTDVIGAMHPEGCPAGTPVEFQWSPTGTRDEQEFVGVVEAWNSHRLGRVPAGTGGVAAGNPCKVALKDSDEVDLTGRVKSPYSIARQWLWADIVGFTSLYGLLLVGLLLNERVRARDRGRARRAPAPAGSESRAH